MNDFDLDFLDSEVLLLFGAVEENSNVFLLLAIFSSSALAICRATNVQRKIVCS